MSMSFQIIKFVVTGLWQPQETHISPHILDTGYDQVATPPTRLHLGYPRLERSHPA